MNLLKFLLNSFRVVELWKVIYTGHTLVNVSRFGTFIFVYMEVGIVNLILWIIISIFYILQIIWKSGYYEFDELKKYHHLIEWLFHIIFHAFFIFTSILNEHFEILFLELAFYWLFDLMFKYYSELKVIKKRLVALGKADEKDDVKEKQENEIKEKDVNPTLLEA